MLTKVFKDANFTLHKWHSNAVELEDKPPAVTGEPTFAKQQLGTPGGESLGIFFLAWRLFPQKEGYCGRWQRSMIHLGLHRRKPCKENLFIEKSVCQS